MNMLKSECVKGIRLLKRFKLIKYLLLLALSCLVVSLFIPNGGSVGLIVLGTIVFFECYYKLFLSPDDFAFYQMKISFDKTVTRRIQRSYYLKQGIAFGFVIGLSCFIRGGLSSQVCFLIMSFVYLTCQNFRIFEQFTPFRTFCISVYYVLITTAVISNVNQVSLLFGLLLFFVVSVLLVLSIILDLNVKIQTLFLKLKQRHAEKIPTSVTSFLGNSTLFMYGLKEITDEYITQIENVQLRTLLFQTVRSQGYSFFLHFIVLLQLNLFNLGPQGIGLLMYVYALSSVSNVFWKNYTIVKQYFFLEKSRIKEDAKVKSFVVLLLLMLFQLLIMANVVMTGGTWSEYGLTFAMYWFVFPLLLCGYSMKWKFDLYRLKKGE